MVERKMRVNDDVMEGCILTGHRAGNRVKGPKISCTLVALSRVLRWEKRFFSISQKRPGNKREIALHT